MMRILSGLALLLAAVCAAGSPAELEAQRVAVTETATREDSLRAYRAARSRQAAFERARRNSLPWTHRGGSDRCDERIGRFCLTYGDDDVEEWVPPEEPESLTRARDRLLEELGSAAELIPGDDWVVGQQVRYLVEAERFADARSAAAACRGAAWWCLALRAFAAHHGGDAAAADEDFARMLPLMPESLRAEWTDLSVILDDRLRRHYRRLADSEKIAFEDRFWMLADPLLGTPGSEVRSEHLARNVVVQLQDRAESTDDLPWGDDLREILIRFGAPTGWERVRPAVAGLMGNAPALVSHYPDSDIDLMPPPEILTDLDPSAGLWDDENRRARASYPLLRGGTRLRWFVPFEHQFAIFRGGDSAHVVAAFSLPADSLPADARVHATLAARASLDGPPLLSSRPVAGTGAVLSLSAPQAPLLVSLEALAPAEHRAGRARVGVDVPRLVPGVLATSDLLVIDAVGDSLPETRDAAIALARGSLRVRPGERVGVYWELYGLNLRSSELLEVSLRLVDTDSGWFRRMAERLGVVRENEPIRLVWGDVAGADETVHRSLTLQIPEGLRAGPYVLELTVSAAGREPLLSRRTLQVSP